MLLGDNYLLLVLYDMKDNILHIQPPFLRSNNPPYYILITPLLTQERPINGNLWTRKVFRLLLVTATSDATSYYSSAPGFRLQE